MIINPTESRLMLPAPLSPRAVGVHVSSIIRCIAIEMGLLQGDDAEDLTLADSREITDPVAIMRMSIGLAWEEWYIKQILSLEGVADHPPSMVLDGIHMSPDGESVLPCMNLCIHEVKATYKSTRTVGDLSKQWMWLTQMKAYCKGAKTHYAKMHTLFLCGDYKFPIQPQIRTWELDFTSKEIDDNWDLLREYRDFKEGR